MYPIAATLPYPPVCLSPLLFYQCNCLLIRAKGSPVLLTGGCFPSTGLLSYNASPSCYNRTVAASQNWQELLLFLLSLQRNVDASVRP